MVWSRFKVFWFSKDHLTGHSERKDGQTRQIKGVGRQYQRLDRNCASSNSVAENRTIWKGIFANSSGAPTTFKGYGIEQNNVCSVSEFLVP